MTAGWTKGRKDYYLYYRCTKHTSVNVPGNLIHEKFEKVLKALSFKEHHIQFLIEKAKAMMAEPMKLKKEKHPRAIEEFRHFMITY